MAADTPIRWADLERAAEHVADRHDLGHDGGVYGVPTGGAVVAPIVARTLGAVLLDAPRAGALIVDDLVDSGATAKRWTTAHPDCLFDALYRKPWAPAEYAPRATEVDGWVRFPWEHDDGDPTDAVTRLLQFVGEDPTRQGLRDTPGRVTRALTEMTEGYRLDPAKLLATRFDADCNEMVVVRAIPFASLCEHHLLPFVGHASVAYVPNRQVVGLSKIARLVDCHARRLQIQERMTGDIANDLVEHLQPEGVGVIVRAFHSCMALRGVRKEAEMVTSALRGLMFHAPQARAEFMALANGEVRAL